MKLNSIKTLHLIAPLVVLFNASSASIAYAAMQGGNAAPPSVRVSHGGDLFSGTEGAVTLSAELVQPKLKASRGVATVKTEVIGLGIVDAVKAKNQPRQTQLQYQIDAGPEIATTAPKLSFHDLPSGKHEITVKLIDNNHRPLGPQETLEVAIPKTSILKEAKEVVKEAASNFWGTFSEPEEPMEMKVRLVEPKARKQAVTVQTEVTGAQIIDPALVQEQPNSGQAHLQYQVDNGPRIATTVPKIEFHKLAPGEHEIR